MKLIESDDFYYDFHENGIIPPYISNLFLKHSGVLFYENKKGGKNIGNLPLVYYLGVVPSYIDISLFNKDNYNLKKINERENVGNAISINSYNNINEYLKSHFKAKYRSNINRYVKRLESSFNITHKMYFGEIKKEKFYFLMNTLKSMLEVRFSQLKKTNFTLLTWKDNYESYFQLIKTKKASLSVIYDNEIPIDISFSFHFNNILFSSTSCFDVDYLKFGLGNISIYKELEWCIKNNYDVYDMTFGMLEYKRKWCDLNYVFESHIYAKKGNINSYLISKFLSAIIGFKNLLKLIKAHILLEIFQAIYLKFKYKGELSINNKSIKYKIENIDTTNNIEKLKEINYQKASFKQLKKPLYDFLYTANENISNIKVYKSENSNQTYFFYGNKKIAKLVIDIS
ncbi:GNAT family N-acetyltransferase [Seonamhaeicola sp. MEBiC1930]|uniref:GNAT family N-acetyltransferase n=1 Tax=Seonamhaeicola sp. MEBiC01930 TaxID=2976768 RepID=UPI00324BE95F